MQYLPKAEERGRRIACRLAKSHLETRRNLELEAGAARQERRGSRLMRKEREKARNLRMRRASDP
jgi:hypothetical protein